MGDMESFYITCPNCQKRLRVKASLAGKRARCPNRECGGVLTIPDCVSAEVPSPPIPTASSPLPPATTNLDPVDERAPLPQPPEESLHLPLNDPKGLAWPVPTSADPAQPCEPASVPLDAPCAPDDGRVPSKEADSVEDRQCCVEWYCQVQGTIDGPLPYDDLQRMAKGGKLRPTDTVKNGQAANWMPASAVEGLPFSAPAESVLGREQAKPPWNSRGNFQESSKTLGFRGCFMEC
jgi:hypothetical protein